MCFVFFNPEILTYWHVVLKDVRVEGSVCGRWRKSLSVRRVALQLEEQEPPVLHICKSWVVLQHSVKIGPHYYPLLCDAVCPLTINVLV